MVAAQPLRALATLALLVAVAAQMDHSGHMAGMAMAAPSGGSRPPCVENPTTKNCSEFKLPHPVVQSDLNSLCKGMHFMPACSIYKACRAMGDGPDAANGSFTAAIGGSPDVCRRLNLVATVCKQDTGMARMAGCLPNYHPMCSTKGSVVKRCTEYPGFAQLPTTKAVNDAVKQLCTAKRSRPGCAACLPSFDAAKTYGSCDLLGTWGGICAAEPKLPQCANHTALCAKDKAWYFCKAGATAITDKGWKLLNATLTAAATTAAGPKAAAHDMSGHDMAGHDHDMAGHDMAGHDHDHDMAGHNKTAPRGLYESPASANTTKPKAASRAACAVAAPLLGLALAVAAALV